MRRAASVSSALQRPTRPSPGRFLVRAGLQRAASRLDSSIVLRQVGGEKRGRTCQRRGASVRARPATPFVPQGVPPAGFLAPCSPPLTFGRQCYSLLAKSLGTVRADKGKEVAVNLSVSVPVYVALSAVMGLEYAIWGAWAPVLAARLLGPLKMSGKQTGWVYATVPLACIFAPLVSGHVADRWVDAGWLLAGCQLVGAMLLFAMVWQRKFAGAFLVMLLYGLCFAATIPLANSVLFRQVSDKPTQGLVFIWAPIAWSLTGYLLSGWRILRKGEGQGSDCLVFAGLLSLVMAACCLLLPQIPPARGEGFPILGALAMLRQPDFLIFVLISLVAAGTVQFYFLGTAQFLNEKGLSPKVIPGTMALAQAVQAAATYFALGVVLAALGFKNTFLVGAGCWALLYLIYVVGRPKALLVVAQPLHGLAFLMLIIAGQVLRKTSLPRRSAARCKA